MTTTSFFKSRHWLSIFALTIACTLWSFTGQESIEDNWVLLKTESSVKAFAAEITCEGNNYIAFQVENNSNETKEVTLSYTVAEDVFAGTITNELLVPANKKVTGGCDDLRFLVASNSNFGKGNLGDRIKLSLTVKE